LQQTVVNTVVVEIALERRVGKHERVFAADVSVGLRECIHKPQVGGFDTVEHQVHGCNAYHGGIEFNAVEHLFVEVLFKLFIEEKVVMILPQVFTGTHEETGRSCCRVADGIGWLWAGHGHHHVDDMPWRTELSVLPCRCYLRQQVLVKVAFGVAVGHVDTTEHGHNLFEQVGRGYHKRGIPHYAVKEGAFVTHLFDEREHLAADHIVHLFGLHLLETAPSKVLLSRQEYRVFNRFTCGIGFVLFQRLYLIEPPDEKQVSDLLNDGKGIGHPSRPERFPYLINLVS
jgi:hypothetical protein